MPSGKFFLYLTHWANLHTCTYNSRAVFFLLFTHKHHITHMNFTRKCPSSISLVDICWRLLGKVVFFFTDLQVCVTIQTTFDQWMRLKTLSADFLSNFNISRGGKAKLLQLNLEDCGNNTVVIKVKRKHTLQTSVFKPEFLAVHVGPKQGCGHPCVISIIDITCSSLVSSSSPGLFHFTSHELFDQIFSFFLLFWLST